MVSLVRQRPLIKRKIRMGGQDPQNVNFLGLNIVILGVFVLVVFGYLLVIIRKRWKTGFLHKGDKNKS